MTKQKIKIIDGIQKEYQKMSDEPYSRGRLLIDKKFHMQIMEMGNNSQLLRIIDSIFDLLIVRRSILHLSPSRPHFAHKEHAEILEALKNKDGRKADQLMKKHIKKAKSFVLDDLKAREDSFSNQPFK